MGETRQSPRPSGSQIRELTAFLPHLYAEGFAPVTAWGGGRQEGGTVHVPWPNYAGQVEAFFEMAGQDCWCDFAYEPAEAGQMLADHELVKAATLEQVKTMLTYCVRGERFCEGHWEDMITEGHIGRLLERLAVLAEAGD